MTRLSAAAQRCRREYNNAYWERKAQALAFDAILTAVPDVEHASASNNPTEYIAQLEREVRSLTRRCGALSRQIRAYQEIIGNAILAAQERETTTVSVVELAENN